jgi:hypothetical protein
MFANFISRMDPYALAASRAIYFGIVCTQYRRNALSCSWASDILLAAHSRLNRS